MWVTQDIEHSHLTFVQMIAIITLWYHTLTFSGIHLYVFYYRYMIPVCFISIIDTFIVFCCSNRVIAVVLDQKVAVLTTKDASFCGHIEPHNTPPPPWPGNIHIKNTHLYTVKSVHQLFLVSGFFYHLSFHLKPGCWCEGVSFIFTLWTWMYSCIMILLGMDSDHQRF